VKGQVFPDPLLLLLPLLRAALAADTSPSALGASVGTKEPSDAFSPALPYVRLSHDGASVSLGVVEEVSVRLAVWHRSDDLGLDLAQRCRAHLMDAADPALRSVLPATGPFQTEDPDSGAPLSFLTLSVRTRPES
jgi:hypothetical protein